VLVTGRRYRTARPIADELGFPVPLVLHNGALVVEGDDVVRCRPLARDAARAVIAIGRGHRAQAVVHLGHRGESRLMVETTGPPPSGLVAYYVERFAPDVREVDDLQAALEEDPIQLMFGGVRADMAALASRLAQAAGARTIRQVYPESDLTLLDVVAESVSKEDGVAFLEARWGIDPAETIAIGDNWNDEGMLLRAGRGFVMGNADPEMHRLGLPVLPTNDEDGVAVAIETSLR
jgi:5-amino-6-(5-phospho-D-ribitylamino)uracil phosphatase